MRVWAAFECHGRRLTPAECSRSSIGRNKSECFEWKKGYHFKLECFHGVPANLMVVHASNPLGITFHRAWETRWFL